MPNVSCHSANEHGKGLLTLGRRRGIMSQRLKEELAKELGFYDVVQREGWGAIRAKDAGNMVRLAIERAERQLAGTTE
ncbi:SspF protein [Geobacillus sp. WSUCF1]|nr:SspF protein [Geobacillus sp. WSUCF1]